MAWWKMATNRLHKFPLLTAEEIENNPTRQDNIAPTKEAKYWRILGQSLFDAVKCISPPM